VFVQKFDSLGNTKWGPNGLRISNLLGNASSINIIPDSVGGAVIGWAEGDTILLSRINSLGNPKYFIVVDPVSNLKGLKMVKGDSVSSILYWISSGGSGDTLYAQYVDSTGTKKWTPKDTIAIKPSIYNFTASRGDSIGSSFIAWTVSGDSIRINKILKNGSKAWGDSGRGVAATGTDIYIGDMNIVSDGAGGAFLVWKHSDETVKAQRFSSSGMPQWGGGTPIVISNQPVMEPYTHAISDGSSGIIIAWEEYIMASNGIYAQRLDINGAKQWTTEGVVVCMGMVPPEKVALTSDGANGAIIVWKDSRSPYGGVYAQRIKSDGIPLWWQDGVPISQLGCDSDTDPNIISDGKGNAIISWSYLYNVYVRKVWSNGLMFQGKIAKISMPKYIFGKPGTIVKVPIFIDKIFPADSVFSCQFDVRTDTSFLKIIGLDTNHTLIGGPGLDTNFTITDTVRYFASAKSYPMSGDTLVKINLQVNNSTKWGNTSWIYIDSLIFNEGKPVVPEVIPGFFAGQFKLMGDVTNNDTTNALDASEILKYVVFKGSAIGNDSVKKILADVSWNGMIMAYDAALVLRYDAKLITHFPKGDTLFAWGVGVGMPRLAPISNSKAEIIANIVRTETDVIIPIELKNINNVLSADIALSYDNELTEFIGYNTTEISKDFQVATNYKDGILYVSMVSAKGITENGKVIELRFRAKGENVDVQFVSFVLNEEEFEVTSELASNLPKKFALYQNYPNPFNPETVIKFDLPKSSDVILKIYNVLGQEIRTLINERKPAGYHSVKWDSRNNNGIIVSSGVYLYKLQAGDFIVTKKMVLIR
jgi:hypothetical protein